MLFWNVLLLETDKIFKRAIFWIELAVLAVIIIGIDLIQYFVSLALPPTTARVLDVMFTWPNGLENASQFADAHTLGGLLLIILLSMITAQEYSWRTYHLWLARGITRFAILGAKCLAALIATLLIVLTSVLVSALVTGILTLLVKGTLPLQQINVTRFLLTIIITYYSLLPYVALAFMLAIVSRSVALAISVGLVFLLLVEGTIYGALTFVHGLASQIVQYLPVGLESALQSANEASTSNILSIKSPPPLVAVLCIAAYVIIFISIGSWRFIRQNFTD